MPGLRRRSVLIGVLALAAALAAAGFLYVASPLLFFLNDPFDDRPFDREVWLQMSGSEDHENPRGRMADDVRRRLLEDRPDRDGVVQLLGEPDFGREESLYQYHLGAWSGFRIDYDSLDVHFDGEGLVEAVRFVQH